MRKSEDSALGLEVGLDFLAGAPKHPKADGRESNARDLLADLLAFIDGNRWIAVRVGVRISVDIFTKRFIEKDEGQELGYVIELRFEEISPGMTVIFYAGGEELHVIAGGEDLVISVRDKALDNDLAFDGALEKAGLRRLRSGLILVKGLAQSCCEEVGVRGRIDHSRNAGRGGINPCIEGRDGFVWCGRGYRRAGFARERTFLGERTLGSEKRNADETREQDGSDSSCS